MKTLTFEGIIHTKGGDCCWPHYGCVRRGCKSRIHHHTVCNPVSHSDGTCKHYMVCEDCPEDARCWR